MEPKPESPKVHKRLLGHGKSFFSSNMVLYVAAFAVIAGFFIVRSFAYNPTSEDVSSGTTPNGYHQACIDPNGGSHEFWHVGYCTGAEKADGAINSGNWKWCADLDGSLSPAENNWLYDGVCSTDGSVSVNLEATPNIIYTDQQPPPPSSYLDWKVTGQVDHCSKLMAPNSPNIDPFWNGNAGSVGYATVQPTQLGLYIYGIKCFDSGGNTLAHATTTVELDQGKNGGACGIVPTVYGDQGTHHVPAPQPTSNSAKIYGFVNENAPPNDPSCQTYYYFVWGPNSVPNNQAPDSPAAVSALPMDNQTHTVNVTLTNLTAHTKYYYEVCAYSNETVQICSPTQSVTTLAPGSGGGTNVTYTQTACLNAANSAQMFKYSGKCSDNDTLAGFASVDSFEWCAAAANLNAWANDGPCPSDSTPPLTGGSTDQADDDTPGDDNPDAPPPSCSFNQNNHPLIVLASTCGTQKKYIKAIYVLPSDWKKLGYNRNFNSNGRIYASLQADNNWLMSQTGGKFLRLAKKNGQFDVPRVVLPFTANQLMLKDADTTASLIIDSVKNAGFTKSTLTYAIYYEGVSGGEPDGQGGMFLGVACGQSQVPSQYTIAYLRHVEQSSVLVNKFYQVEGCSGGLTKDPTKPTTGDFVMMHELMHGLGYVQASPNPNKCVPHSSDNNPNQALTDHVTDGANIDLLYYNGLSKAKASTLTLDVGHDDYFKLPKGSKCSDFNKDPNLAVKPKS